MRYGQNRPTAGGAGLNARASYFRQDEIAQATRAGSVASHKRGEAANASKWARNAAYRNNSR